MAHSGRGCTLLVVFAVYASISGALTGKALPKFEKIIFIDYSVPRAEFYGPACPTTKTGSETHRLLKGGVRWTSFPVLYRISGMTTTQTSEVTTAFENWDAAKPVGTWPSAGFFLHSAVAPNTVSFGTIDGPGGAVAVTTLTFNPVTKQIVGFEIGLDSEEAWGIGAPNAFDIQNVAAHEVGHVVGLGDVTPPKDCWLTMYRYTYLGDVAKRTLTAGDVLGMAALYS